jgi:hypothetical protein
MSSMRPDIVMPRWSGRRRRGLNGPWRSPASRAGAGKAGVGSMRTGRRRVRRAGDYGGGAKAAHTC